MAKTIKFNLICDGKPVRTIEDLQNNFSIEDVLAYYDNRLLHRWLRVRGYEDELKAVSAITSTDSKEIILQLIHIFDVTTDEEKILENIYILNYQNEKMECCAIYAQQDYDRKLILEDYEAGYRQLVDDILANPIDLARIKANISAITSDYTWAFELDHRRLFNILDENKYHLVIMCLLMNDVARKYYLPIEVVDASGTITLDVPRDADKVVMYNRIKSIVASTEFREKYMAYIERKVGSTNHYWDDLKYRGKYMILSMESGCNVKPYNEMEGNGLGYEQVKDKFIILDGLKYRSDKAYAVLLYMEV